MSIQPRDAFRRLQAESPPILIDVREPHEIEQVRILGAIPIHPSELAAAVVDRQFEVDQEFIICCATGVRSSSAVLELSQLGFHHAASLEGGITAWRDALLPVIESGALTASQQARYDRQIRLPEIGVEGQLKLSNARILLIGAGGLGCPAALYLAAAGVGTLGIVDDDVVEISNLQRQILHSTDSISLSKTWSARQSLTAINPEIAVVEHRTHLTANNAASIIDGYDIVIDGTDNIPTRYALNDAAVALLIPVIHGSIHRFEGQVTVLSPGRGPCYRCLYPLDPKETDVPSCNELGVLGVLPGIIGTLQATEALKLILGIGDPLIGRILIYDALAASTSELTCARSTTCPVCANTKNFD